MTVGLPPGYQICLLERRVDDFDFGEAHLAGDEKTSLQPRTRTVPTRAAHRRAIG
jgi:hypothetical protein